jgi:hypothetical protein
MKIPNKYIFKTIISKFLYFKKRRMDLAWLLGLGYLGMETMPDPRYLSLTTTPNPSKRIRDGQQKVWTIN